MKTPAFFILSYLFVLLISCDSTHSNQQDLSPIAYQQRICGLTQSLPLYYFPNQISVIGTFNDFQPNIHPMTYDETTEKWHIELPLAPGIYLYAFEIDGEIVLDQNQPQSGFFNGIEYSLIEVEDCRLGKWQMIVNSDLNQDALQFPQFQLQYQAGKDFPSIDLHDIKLQILKDQQVQSISPEAIQYDMDQQSIHIDTRFLKQSGKYRLQLLNTNESQPKMIDFEGVFWIEAQSFSWKDALIYQVVIDRFMPPNPTDKSISQRLGGQLEGVIKKLDEGYFDELGVKAIWLSPLYPNASGLWSGVEGGERKYEGYHGYWPIQARAVGDEWGGEASLKMLVSKAHQKGIRILADVVLNHVHQNHEYYQSNPQWFHTNCVCGYPDCSWADNIQTCQFTPYLPDVNWWDQNEVLIQFTEDAQWWLKAFDLDGLRIDAVPMMPRAVIRRLVKAVHDRFEGLGTRHYLIGETFTGANQRNQIRRALGANGLEGQFDFPLLWAIRDSFALENQSLIDLVKQVKLSQEAWDKSDGFMGNFIGNHDMQRFMLSAVQNDALFPKEAFDAWQNPPPQPSFELPYLKQWLAQAFAYVMEGTPFLYYGDEIGMMGLSDPDNRRAMLWDTALLNPHQIKLRNRLKWLGQLRQCAIALRRGQIHWLSLTAERIALIKGEGEESALLIFSRKSDPSPWSLAIPPEFTMLEWQRLNELGNVSEAISTQPIDQNRKGLFFNQTEPYSLEIYLPKNHFCIMQP